MKIHLSYSFLFALALVSCRHEEKTISDSEIIPEVDVIAIKSLQPSMDVVLPGELKAWNKTFIHAKVNGYVGHVFVDRGTYVKKGQLLARLEAPEIVAALSQSKAKALAADAALIEQKAKLHASTLTYRRIVETSSTPGAVSANELDTHYARLMADSALTMAAKENLSAAQAYYASQQQLVEYLAVKAPFDGTITERNVSPGELVGDSGRPMFVLEDQSTLRLTVSVPERLTNSVRNNTVVSFSVQADPLKIYEAPFARSANSLQESSRTMIAEFDFNNLSGALKAGMYAEVKLPLTRSVETLFVPKSALINSTEGIFVVRVKDNTAEWINIQKGNTLDSLVEVFGSVQAGEQIVTNASEELRNGKPLKIRKLKV